MLWDSRNAKVFTAKAAWKLVASMLEAAERSENHLLVLCPISAVPKKR
jgi:hypothetical protein